MKRLVLRSVLPALLAIALFTGVVFMYLMPAFNRVVMDQKRLMIRELTESAWNIMARFEAEEQAGRLSREDAQAAAITHVRSLHYGLEQKDYFWINDMQPRMIVHPFRPDLEGDDLSTYSDPDGKLVFQEMVDVVRRQESGYVTYTWQWKDQPDQLAAKISYVKGFEPWQWVIGTGVYTDDVDAEVQDITGRLQAATLLILLTVTGLLVLLLRNSFQSEKGRQRATTALRDSEVKHRTMVEAAGEAIVMVLGQEQLFANPSMLHLLGYDRQEFAAQDIDQIIRPTVEEETKGQRYWEMLASGSRIPPRYEVELQGKDGQPRRVMLSLSRIEVQGRTGFMAIATRLVRQQEMDLDTAGTPAELVEANRRMPVMASLMLTHGTDAQRISRMLTQNGLTVVRRSVEMAVGELGPPPVPFDVILMGSLGRGELTMFTDQDNTLIFADVPEDELEDTRRYFKRLGRRLSQTLDAAGYAYCDGGIMAGNPKWCLSLSEWKQTFSTWINTMEAEDLLKASIFFDFRSTLDQPGLVPALHEHLWMELDIQKRFFFLLARNVLMYEPPLSAFGSFVLEERDATHETFDVKGVMAQIVDYVRIRALQQRLTETNTLDRLDQLVTAGALKQQTADDTAEAMQFLMDLRMRHQAREILARQEPNNRIEPAVLTEEEQKELKRVFSHIKALQAGLDHEFKGA